MNELDRVLQEVRKQMEFTVLSYEQRDPEGWRWGDPNYPGNCSGKVPLGFIDKLGAKSVAEVFAGSGTLSDVCRDYQIPYCGIDLNPNPVRKDIRSMDVLDADMPDFFRGADMCFSHPPYPGIHRVQYAASAWKDTTHCAARDIQNYSFADGIKLVNQAHMRVYSALRPGAYMVILVGEIRSKGQYYSMYRNLALPGELFQTYVKLQHNTWSGRQSYSGKNNPRAFTSHEMIAVVKKPSGYEMMYVIPRTVRMDIRDSQTVTWKDVVLAALHKFHSSVTLDQLYSEIEGHEKTRSNNCWREKIRQSLQLLEKAGLAVHLSRGIWQLAA